MAVLPLQDLNLMTELQPTTDFFYCFFVKTLEQV